MNRLDRYVLGRFIAILAGCLLAIAIVFVAVDYVGAIRTWADRDRSQILAYYRHSLPYILFLVSPIAVLLASMFTIAGFARRLELAAMLSAGRPLWRILMPIWLAGIAYSGFWAWAVDDFMPHSNAERIRIRAPKRKSAFSETPWKIDFAWRAAPGVTFFFRDYNGVTGQGSRTTITWTDSVQRVSERIDVQRAAWDGKIWLLQDGFRRTFRGDGSLGSFQRIDSLKLAVARSHPEDLVSRKNLPDEMTRAEMQRRIAAMREAGEPVLAWEAEAEFRRSSPWVTAIVVLIGTSLAALVGRRGQALAFGAGILIAFAFYVSLRVGLALGHAGTLTPMQSAWWAHGFFLLLGLVFLWRASRN